MKILQILPYDPTPRNFGGALRIFNILNQMTARHDVTVVGLGRPSGGDNLMRAFDGRLRAATFIPNQWARRNRRMAQLISLGRSQSFFTALGRSGELQKFLYRELERNDYDIIQTEFSHMAGYELPSDAVKILDAHNVEYDLFRRIAEKTPSRLKRALYTREYQKFYREEIGYCRRQDGILVTSERDRDLLSRDIADVPQFVVPNGVDASYFRGDASAVEHDSIVFTGVMRYLPNSDGMLWFLREIFPLVQAAVPNVKVYVVGGDPPPELLALNSDRIVVTGSVDDVRPFINRAAACIVPLRMGGGTRLKVVEALAMEKPVISTTLGVEGIDVRHGETAMIADDPAAFASSVIDVLGDRGLRAKLTIAGYELMMNRYEWSVVGRSLEEAYKELQNNQLARRGEHV